MQARKAQKLAQQEQLEKYNLIRPTIAMKINIQYKSAKIFISLTESKFFPRYLNTKRF